MVDSVEHSWERFYLATRSLASGTGDIRNRLSTVWWSYLLGVVIANVPWDDIQSELEEIQRKLTPEISESDFTQRTITEHGLSEIAENIVDLYQKICQRRYSKI